MRFPLCDAGSQQEKASCGGTELGYTARSSAVLLLVIPWKAGLQLEFITTVELVGKLENIALC